MAAYYNEIDTHAAAWLRNLIANGHIAPGDVDERSIADVRPDDLRPYTQCHFFAGIGVWSYALRRAGWPDERPVWPGSGPCQPFSAAGRGEGFADERHLWPAFHHLIAQRRPPVVFGEQVASKAVDPWIDLVQDDMEGLGYAFGAVPFPSAGVGAPHIRDRAYFVAHAYGAGPRTGQRHDPSARHGLPASADRVAGELANAGSSSLRWGREPRQDAGASSPLSGEVREQRLWADVCADGAVGGLADATRLRHSQRELRDGEGSAGSPTRDNGAGRPALVGVPWAPGAIGDGVLADTDILHGDGTGPRAGDDGRQFGGSAELRQQSFVPDIGHNSGPGPTNGFWRDPDWLHCRDGRWRPVEPGTFPLVDGSSFRVDSGSAYAGKSRSGMLKGAGNAINAEAAATFIFASVDVLDGRGDFRLKPMSVLTTATGGIFD